MSERARDLLVTGGFLAVIGGLVAVGWMNREPSYAPVSRGEIAPPFELDRLEGGRMALDELRGKVVLLNIWATWCAPCRAEMPAMQRVYEDLAGEGLEIVAVAVDEVPGVRQPDGSVTGIVGDFVEELQLTFPILLDPTGGTQRLYGVSGLPTTFLIDREGRIRAREMGGRFWDQEPYIEMIRRLLED